MLNMIKKNKLIGHYQTLFGTKKAVHRQSYKRIRITTKDHDFLNLDCLFHESKPSKVIILCHGLEGSSKAFYIQDTAKYFHGKGFDVISLNFRSCGGEMNNLPKFYHGGQTEDLHEVIENIENEYTEIYLKGFSLGANLILKYLGENREISPKIIGASAISVPLSLGSSAKKLNNGLGKIYSHYFLDSIKKKVQLKRELLKDTDVDVERILKAKKLYEIDEYLLPPLYGFKNANDYFNQSSAYQFLNSIKVPTLIMNALNDPFLGKDCYPEAHNIQNSYIKTLTPAGGGHVTFHYEGEDYYPAIKSYQYFMKNQSVTPLY